MEKEACIIFFVKCHCFQLLKYLNNFWGRSPLCQIIRLVEEHGERNGYSKQQTGTKIKSIVFSLIEAPSDFQIYPLLDSNKSWIAFCYEFSQIFRAYPLSILFPQSSSGENYGGLKSQICQKLGLKKSPGVSIKENTVIPKHPIFMF